MAKTMTDEERYGKVGAEIRRLDPEAYKNRPKTLEGNLKLLKELRGKSKETPARQMSADEFMADVERRQERSLEESEPASLKRGPQNPRRYSGQGAAERQASQATVAMEQNRSRLPSDRATNFKTQAQETGLNESERAEKGREYAKNIAMTAAAGGAGRLAGAPYARTAGQFRRAADEVAEKAGRALSRRGVPSEAERYAAGESAAARRAEFRRRKDMEEAMGRFRAEKEASSRLSRGAVYKKGGAVKSSASSRADGIAKKGKTRGKYV
jgi:hypothetical protein